MVEVFLGSVFVQELTVIATYLQALAVHVDPIYFGVIITYIGFIVTKKAIKLKKLKKLEQARFLTLVSSMLFGIGIAFITGMYDLIPISAIGVSLALGTEMLKNYEILDFNVPIKAVRDAFKGVSDKYNKEDDEKDEDGKK